MARLLLKRWGARLLLAVPILSMSACIIPVAPDFQDPLGASNVPPYLHDWSPPFGSVVSITAPGQTTFSTQVTDPNVMDPLFFRWVFDYPPSPGATTTIEFSTGMDSPPATGTSHSATFSIPLYCGKLADPLINGSTPHKLMLIVADGPFDDSDLTKKDKTPPGVYPQEIDWTVVFQCPGSP